MVLRNRYHAKRVLAKHRAALRYLGELEEELYQCPRSGLIGGVADALARRRINSQRVRLMSKINEVYEKEQA